MIRSIKKLFSIDESELDLEEIETTEEKSSLYQQELNQYKENPHNLDLNGIDVIEERGNKFKEIEEDTIITNTNPNIPVAEAVVEATDKIDVVEVSTDTQNHRQFDFASEIDEAYSEKPVEEVASTTPNKPVIKEIKVKKVKTIKPEPNKPLSTDELVNKDNYVLKDIISPMRGVIRRETNSIKRDEEHKKAQIIKLREHVTTTEIDPDGDNVSFDDDFGQTIEFPFSDTKKIEMNQLDRVPKDTLSETSKFTLIEDSTGEMRLVIDEDE